MVKLTRCTPEMALCMRRVQAHSCFIVGENPVLDTLLARGWIYYSDIWQYDLTREGYERLCEWKKHKRKKYRNIGLRNPIYADKGGYWAYYFPVGKYAFGEMVEQINLDPYIIKEMIENEELVYSEDGHYWFAPHKTGPCNRTHGIDSCDLPF